MGPTPVSLAGAGTVMMYMEMSKEAPARLQAPIRIGSEDARESL